MGRKQPSATWAPAPEAAAQETHAAAQAIALCNSPEGREQRLWIELWAMRDQTLSWVEILAALTADTGKVWIGAFAPALPSITRRAG